MNDITDSVVPVKKSARATPTMDMGTANIIERGWVKDSNWEAITI
jgi:hypothetical protein